MVLLMWVAILPVASKDLYVSPRGTLDADGSLQSPFRTIDQARALARHLVGKEALVIHLDDGIYYLESPIVFTPEDGGNQACPVYYRAVNEGKAIISGGRLLQVNWIPFREGIYVCEVPKGTEIDQLFINNKRQEMARFPNSIPGKNVFDHWTLSHSAGTDPENDPLSREKIATWNNPERQV